MSDWDGYAIQKIGLAFNKLVEQPDAGWAGGAFAEAQSDLTAVNEDDVPEKARADLNTVKNAAKEDIEVIRAISRLRVMTLEDAQEPGS